MQKLIKGGDIINQEHPIQGLMTTAMNSIKDMVDVDTIVGEAVETPDGTVVIPISRVSFGFAAGGGEYSTSHAQPDPKREEEKKDSKLPFGGGSGAGVSINPIGFLVVGQGQIRLLPVGGNSSIERLVDSAPDIVNKLNDMLGARTNKNKNEKTENTRNTKKTTEEDTGEKESKTKNT